MARKRGWQSGVAIIVLYCFFTTVSSQRYFTDPSPQTQYCGNNPADVVFLVDSSNSIYEPDFDKQIQFIGDVVDMFQIGPQDTQVGLMLFNDATFPRIELLSYRTKRQLKSAIRRVRKVTGLTTDTALAIKVMRKKMFSQWSGARPGVPHIAIIITDGYSLDRFATLRQATIAKRRGIHIFTIGVGGQISERELARIASRPHQQNSFVVAGYSFLETIKEKLAIEACKITTPPPTTTTSTTTTTTTTTTTPPPTTTTSTTTTTTPTTTTTTTTPTTTTTTTTPTTTTTTTTPTTTTTTTTPTTTTTTTTPTTTTTTPTTTTTTTTPSTTTTTTVRIPTTTTWQDSVRHTVCKSKPADVVFALDASNVITPHDFWYQVKFVSDFSRALDVGRGNTRIGVVMYDDKVETSFDLNEHDHLAMALRDLYQLRLGPDRGATRLDVVIRHVTTRSFRRSVSRRGASQLVVLVTGSSTSKLHRLKKEMKRAEKTGVEILTVAVGNKINEDALSIIMGGKKQAGFYNILHNFPSKYSDPDAPGQKLFRVDSYERMEDIVMDAAVQACSADKSPVAVADQACGTRQEADVMFVMDSASAGKKNTKKSLDFMKKIASEVEIGKSKAQIGLIHPDECDTMTSSFRLGAMNDKRQVTSALDKSAGDELTSLLRSMRKGAFKKREGGRYDAKKIAVILVDEALEKPLKALKEARLANIRGIEVYIIVVGQKPLQPEVKEMCSYPPSQHLYQIPDYDKLTSLENSLIDVLCDEL